MRGRDGVELPSSLSRLEQRFAAWRAKCKRGERIPIALWEAAAKAAIDHGLNRTATTLKLDYDSLRKRVGPQQDADAVAFVELPAVPALADECLIEIEDGLGARMRVHVRGSEVPDVVSLVQSFWVRD